MSMTADTLDRLTSVFQTLHWPVRHFLQAGLEQATIDSLLAELPTTVADEIVVYFGWHNGLTTDAPENTQFCPIWTPLSLQSALETYRELREVDQRGKLATPPSGDFWDEPWFPLFGHPASGKYCFSSAKNPPQEQAPIFSFWVQAGESLEYDSLTSLIQTTIDAALEGVFRCDDVEVVCTNRRRFGQIFQRHNPQTADLLFWQATGGTRRVEDVVPALLRYPGFEAASPSPALWRLPDERFIPPLLPLLANPENDIWLPAVNQLGALMATEAVPTLLEYLTHPDRQRQLTAISILGEIGDHRAVMPLLELLGDTDLERSQWVVRALGKLRDGRATPALVEILAKATAELQTVVLEALGAIGNRAAIPALVSLLGQPEMTERVQLEVAWQLAVLGGTTAEAALTEAATHHPSKLVQEVAEEGLARIHRQQAEGEPSL